jgi:hypothetical protein
MNRCRCRYEDLPAHLKAQVDAQAGGRKAEVRSQNPEVRGQSAKGGLERTTGSGRRGPNKTEAAYRAEVLGRRGDVVAVQYEPLTLRMANGHRYTPDWVVATTAGRIECHEVKGGYALPSHQRARLAFDQARIEFPWIVWVWAKKTENGWMKGG